MPEHWTPEDKRRTAPIRARLIARLLPEGRDEGPWVDMDKTAAAENARIGTCLSKLRELNDKHHVHLGLKLESRPIGGGHWEYRVVKRKPEQMPLFEQPHPSRGHDAETAGHQS